MCLREMLDKNILTITIEFLCSYFEHFIHTPHIAWCVLTCILMFASVWAHIWSIWVYGMNAHGDMWAHIRMGAQGLFVLGTI